MPLTQIPTGMYEDNSVTASKLSSDLRNQTPAFKNRIINGDMRIDQRNAGASFTVLNASGYGSCDRWASLAGATSTWTMQRVATSDSDFPNALRVGRNSGSASTSAIYVGQVIETNNCQDFAGQSATFSFFARAGANFSASGGNLTCEVWTGSGTDQGWQSLNSATWTTQALAASNNATLTTTRQRFTYSFPIAAGTKEIAIRFAYAGVGTAGVNDWFEITGVQLEKGSAATEFDRRPYGTELALCQRYFEKSVNQETAVQVATQATYYGGIPATIATGVWYLTIPFKVTKRAAPTVTTYPYTTPANTNRFSNNTGTDYGANSGLAGGIYDTQFSVQNNSGGTLAVGSGIVFGSWFASAEL